MHELQLKSRRAVDLTANDCDATSAVYAVGWVFDSHPRLHLEGREASCPRELAEVQDLDFVLEKEYGLLAEGRPIYQGHPGLQTQNHVFARHLGIEGF
jgi:hypothetical protein